MKPSNILLCTLANMGLLFVMLWAIVKLFGPFA